jgi:UDP-N-acetylglucosamine acyltransferase
MSIHPTATIDPSSEIHPDAGIGPYCVIGPEVQIGAGTVLDSHVVVEKWSTIGENCRFYSLCSVGTDPQDIKYHGEKTTLVIGRNNVVREFSTINRGTPGGGGITRIGDDNFFLAYSHVAHDAQMGSGILMANAATLAGHVTVCDHSTVGAFSAVHQFCRVGPHAFIGGFSVVTRDALPYVKTVGARNEAKIYGINTIGLERKGIPKESIEELKQVYRILFRSQMNTGDALARVRERGWKSPEVGVLVEFIESSTRGIMR